MRPIRQPADLFGQIPAHPPMHRHPMHPDLRRNLGDSRARQHGPDRVQTLLHNRQHDQCQSRPP